MCFVLFLRVCPTLLSNTPAYIVLQTAKLLAKQVVTLRTQKQRMMQARGRIKGVAAQTAVRFGPLCSAVALAKPTRTSHRLLNINLFPHQTDDELNGDHRESDGYCNEGMSVGFTSALSARNSPHIFPRLFIVPSGLDLNQQGPKAARAAGCHAKVSGGDAAYGDGRRDE